jgi:hypothetical protein
MAEEQQYPVDAVTESAMQDSAAPAQEPKGLGMSLDDLVKNHKSSSRGAGGGRGGGGDRMKVRAVIRKNGGGPGGGGGRGGGRGGGFGGRGNAGPQKVRRRVGWGEM